jgi:hypothetical protein
MISFLATANYIHFKKIAYFSLRTETVMVNFSYNIASAMVRTKTDFDLRVSNASEDKYNILHYY